MNRNRIFTAAAAALVLIAAVITFGLGQSSDRNAGIVQTSESAVHSFADFAAIDDTYSQLIRTDGGVAMELRTSGLEPDSPYTVWWVVFNTPGGCSEACGEDDIFGADGLPAPNPDAGVSILWATGNVTDGSGAATFSAYLPEGRPLGEVVLGEGLQAAIDAEIHLVVRAHGAADLARLNRQLNSFEPHPALGGSCEACQDVQFAMHLPAAATASN